MSKHLHVMIEQKMDNRIRGLSKRHGDFTWIVRAALEAGLAKNKAIVYKGFALGETPDLISLHITVDNKIDKQIRKLCIRRGDLSCIVRQLLIEGLKEQETITESDDDNNGEGGASKDNNSLGEDDWG